MKSLTLLLALIVFSSAEDTFSTDPPPIATKLPEPVPPKPIKPVFDFEKACCLLEWTKLIDLKDGTKALPSTAILFGERNDQIRVFLASDGVNYAVVTNEQLDFLMYWTKNNTLIGSREWDKAYILSNPYNCDIGWFNRQKGRCVQNTMERYFPAINKELIARINNDKNVIEKIGVLRPSGIVEAPQDFYGMNADTKKVFDEKNPEHSQVLYVDCAITLKKQLKAELYHIEFESDKFNTGFDDFDGNKQTVATTEVINNSDNDQMVNVELNAELSSSLEMKHETRLNETTDVKWGVHGSTSLGWLAKLFGIKFNLDGGYDSHTIKNKFASEGEVSFEAKQTIYKFHQEVLIKGRTRNQITINTNQVEGNQKYTAYYRLKPDPKNTSLNETSIRAIFTRLGHPDIELKSINGSLVYTTEGFMSISAGFNTHVLIESYSLNSDTDELVFRQKIPI